MRARASYNELRSIRRVSLKLHSLPAFSYSRDHDDSPLIERPFSTSVRPATTPLLFRVRFLGPRSQHSSCEGFLVCSRQQQAGARRRWPPSAALASITSRHSTWRVLKSGWAADPRKRPTIRACVHIPVHFSAAYKPNEMAAKKDRLRWLITKVTRAGKMDAR